ncbi:glycosyltransferase family 4 protein [Candidatus Pacearchaeota archaeon]|nr:glycosyltransferase family 4 protein [Candidatus Pacearchaeota archaeon]
MKIVHVLAYYGDYKGGIQNYVKELSREQKKQGHEVKIITSTRYGKEKEIDGIPILRCWTPFVAFRVPFTISLPFKLFIEKCDVLHVHLPLPWLDLNASLKKIIHKKTKLVITIHNDLQINSLTSKIAGNIHNKFLIKSVLKRADKVITTTKEFANSLPYKIPRNKHVVIPLGVDTKDFHNLNIQKKEQILFVGRLIPEKGLHLLVDVMIKLRKDFPNLKLAIAYQKLYNYDNYYDLIKEKSKGFLIEHHNCNKVELNKLYNESLFVVLPSLQESFGTVILEALACGSKIVTFKLPGPFEAISEKYVKFVKLNDSEELLNQIRKLLKKSKKNKGSQKYVKVFFDWSKIAKSVEEVYKK